MPERERLPLTQKRFRLALFNIIWDTTTPPKKPTNRLKETNDRDKHVSSQRTENKRPPLLLPCTPHTNTIPSPSPLVVPMTPQETTTPLSPFFVSLYVHSLSKLFSITKQSCFRSAISHPNPKTIKVKQCIADASPMQEFEAKF